MTSLPSAEKISEAVAILNNTWMHFYQLLYEQTPRLTSPGKGSMRPFEVSFSEAHSAVATSCLKFQYTERYTHPNAADFHFVVCVSGTRDGDEIDCEVLEKCALILQAVKEKKAKPDRLACCPLAVACHCVCAYSCDCILHGRKCVGTHD